MKNKRKCFRAQNERLQGGELVDVRVESKRFFFSSLLLPLNTHVQQYESFCSLCGAKTWWVGCCQAYCPCRGQWLETPPGS